MNWLSVLIIFAGLLSSFQKPKPFLLGTLTEGPQVVEFRISHVFGKQIDIQAKFKPSEDIENVVVIIEMENNIPLTVETLIPTPLGEIFYIYKISHPAIQPFSILSIGFKIKMSDGSIFTIEPIEYFYDDNRFQWQSIKTDEFIVSWYHEDHDLGSEILKTAHEGLSRINSFLHVPTPESIRIYAYADLADLQDTLKFSGEATSWVAGHANPDFGTIVVSLPEGPEQRVEIGRQIPHELTHILLYQKIGPAYSNIPHWLNEGLATYSELYPNPNYQVLLKKAYEKGTLIPIENLCDNFPIDAANFQLAYAEAYAFTRYLHESYGLVRTEELIQVYAQGQNCDQAIQTTYQLSLSDIEQDWLRAEFSTAPKPMIGNETLPLMILISFAFIVPISLIIKGVGRH